MRPELRRLANSEEPGGEPGVMEHELRRLHQAFSQVRVKRREAKHEVAGFEHREPGFRRRLGDPAVPGERREVEQLSRASGAQFHETLEGAEITDAQELADIPLDVGVHVGAQPGRRLEFPVEDARKAAGQQGPVKSLWRPPETLDLAPGQRQEFQHVGAPRERLADRAAECEVLRSGQDPASVDGIVVHDSLQVGKEVGNPLDLVEDGSLRELREKAARISVGEGADVRRFETHVRTVAEHSPAEGRLAALPGASERDDGRTVRRLQQRRGEIPLDHGGKNVVSCRLIQNRILK